MASTGAYTIVSQSYGKYKCDGLDQTVFNQNLYAEY